MSQRQAEEAVARARNAQHTGIGGMQAKINMLEHEVVSLEAKLKAANATIRALQSSNHVIFN